MNFWEIIILGIIEGLTEFLPISSTGHLILVSRLLALPETAFLSSFLITIQLGAMMAIVALYWRTLIFDQRVWKLIGVAFLPTGMAGLIFYPLIKNYLLDSVELVLSTLFIGGIALLLFEWWYEEPVDAVATINGLSWKQAFLIGSFQALAIIPGLSRSGATILGGLFLGLNRRTIVEFSFLLALPTMFIATFFDLVQNYQSFTQDDFQTLTLGFMVAFFCAILSVKLLLKLITKYSFTVFGVYRIIISLLLFAILF